MTQLPARGWIREESLKGLIGRPINLRKCHVIHFSGHPSQLRDWQGLSCYGLISACR